MVTTNSVIRIHPNMSSKRIRNLQRSEKPHIGGVGSNVKKIEALKNNASM
jgi:hypothetical protein